MANISLEDHYPVIYLDELRFKILVNYAYECGHVPIINYLSAKNKWYIYLEPSCKYYKIILDDEIHTVAIHLYDDVRVHNIWKNLKCSVVGLIITMHLVETYILYCSTYNKSYDAVSAKMHMENAKIQLFRRFIGKHPDDFYKLLPLNKRVINLSFESYFKIKLFLLIKMATLAPYNG